MKKYNCNKAMIAEGICRSRATVTRYCKKPEYDRDGNAKVYLPDFHELVAITRVMQLDMEESWYLILLVFPELYYLKEMAVHKMDAIDADIFLDEKGLPPICNREE